MRLDYMMTVWDPGNRRSYADVLRDYRDQVVAAEQAGFVGAWMGEHHFQEEGFDILPNPILLAAHMAAATTQIRVGLGAVSVPLWNPLRLAEDVAVLDHMSSGRVDCAFSRGIDPRDILNLNAAADRSDPERSLGIFLEGLDVLDGAWTNDAFSFAGTQYTIPYPGIKTRDWPWHYHDARRTDPDGRQIALNVVPKPYQRPYPPLFIVSETRDGFQLAAGRGMGALTWLRAGRGLDELTEVYRGAAPEELRPGQNCGVLRPCLVAPTFEEARHAVEQAMYNMGESMSAGPRGRAAFSNGEDDNSPEALAQPWFEFLLERDHILVGTPASVSEQIARIRDDHGIEHILCWMSAYGIEQRDTMRSIELFGEQVLPAFSSEGEPAPVNR